ncbi:MAG: FAD-dependent oxidoreductase [Ruminococcaceae bacterium]|nr:FAD-dependent oxidoreductase [Oscillospiraceae bacterium]
MFEQNVSRENYDFVVVGGGLTGVCAAMAAARNGARVALIHDRPVLGGNASSEIRMHVCGATANMKKPDLSEGGILHELMLSNKRVNDSYNFSIWDAVLFDAVKKEPNLTVYLNTTMFGVKTEQGTVKEIEAYQMSTERRLFISGRFFADCTGNGTLSAFVGATFRTGSEAKAEFGELHAPTKANNDRMGNTLLFKAADRGHPVPFVPPVDAMRFTEEQLKYRKHSLELPKEILDSTTEEERRMLFDGYAQDYGYWWIEIPGEKENIIEEYEEIRDQLVRAVYGVWDHIKNGGDHGADNFELTWVGMLPGTRESRRIECDYMLCETDLLEGRRFADAVAYGGWHIDNHVGLFKFDQIPSFVYEVPGSYDIPYRSYCVKGFTNLFVGGRCMGASKLAMASARVMGTCAIGGQAIGTAAALLAAADSNDIRQVKMDQLQETLLKDDCYLPGRLNRDPADLARGATVTATSAQNGYEANNVLNGVSRRVGEKSNAWRSLGLSQNGETLTLSLAAPARLKTAQLIFDSNFDLEKKITLSSRRQKQQLVGIPAELVKDFDLILSLDGQVVEKQEIRGNYQRLCRIRLGGVSCDTVTVRVLATNGAPEARIFEVRLYE